MLVDFSTLSEELKSKFPLTLQLENGIIELTDLPQYIQKLIVDFKVTENVKTVSFTDVVDIDFDKSLYNDVTIISTKKDAIIKYIRNYLLTPIGTYPFDPDFGNALKTHLQTRDTNLRNLLIDSELKKIVSIINTSFQTDVVVLGSKLTPVNLFDRIEYHLDIQIKINDDKIVFTIS